MSSDDLSPMPTPAAEEPELYPGGADAITDDPADNGLGRDLGPEDNPAIDDALPAEIAEPDEKPQAPEEEADDAEDATTDDDGDDSGDADGPDAGQTAEDGTAEPPA